MRRVHDLITHDIQCVARNRDAAGAYIDAQRFDVIRANTFFKADKLAVGAVLVASFLVVDEDQELRPVLQLQRFLAYDVCFRDFAGRILAIGLAINAAPVLWAIFGSLVPGSQAHEVASVFSVQIANNTGTNMDGTSNFNILSKFLVFYVQDVIFPASYIVVPYACRICLILAAIDMGLQLGLQLVEGDKVKFLVSKCLTTGIYLFLIVCWVGDGSGTLQLMNELEKGMKGLGYAAGAVGQSETGKDPFVGDDVIANMFVVWSTYWKGIGDASIIMKVAMLLMGIFVVIMMLLIAMEMIMTHLEFWTMALLTIPLLAFGVIPQLKFLSEKAIGAMFNLGIKMMCISFLAGVVASTLTSYVKKVAEADKANSAYFGNAANSLTFIVLVLMLYILVKKMPALIQGLLSGNPALSSGDMMGTATSVANGIGNAAGRVSAAMGGGSGGGGGGGGSSGGGGGGGGGSGVRGSLQQLKQHAGDLAMAAATGGTGAVMKAGGKMLANAVKNKAANAAKKVTDPVKNAANAISEAKKNPKLAAAKLGVNAGLAAGSAGLAAGNLVKGVGKAGLRYAQSHVPGLQGYYEGKAAYSKDSSAMGKDDAGGSGGSGGGAGNLADQRAMMGSMMEAIGGEDMRKKFEDNFDKAMQFEPSQPPPMNPMVKAALDHNKKRNEDE